MIAIVSGIERELVLVSIGILELIRLKSVHHGPVYCISAGPTGQGSGWDAAATTATDGTPLSCGTFASPRHAAAAAAAPAIIAAELVVQLPSTRRFVPASAGTAVAPSWRNRAGPVAPAFPARAAHPAASTTAATTTTAATATERHS